jgi:hypothetical protein
MLKISPKNNAFGGNGIKRSFGMAEEYSSWQYGIFVTNKK